MSKRTVEVSTADQAKVAVLQQVIAECNQKIAELLGAYLDMKGPRLAQPHEHQHLHEGAPLLKCEYLIITADGACGCYRNPPGVCETC